jgi:hypothetical protein
MTMNVWCINRTHGTTRKITGTSGEERGDMAEYIGGAFLLVLAVALIAAGYIVHMYHVLRDIAREDAQKMADRLFTSYVENCEYRVTASLRIVDEMGRHR